MTETMPSRELVLLSSGSLELLAACSTTSRESVDATRSLIPPSFCSNIPFREKQIPRTEAWLDADAGRNGRTSCSKTRRSSFWPRGLSQWAESSKDDCGTPQEPRSSGKISSLVPKVPLL
eukprot:CAMPEP_0175195840 /NCGR_PEP_ID=MMETSP0093-20121207/7205_1 /TAXON_ID=311494 /ORGANISM="Alexandrium monilatum, Strain CCMP3105" /LENGTH=119 /DNA_ID=CAMNT_0016488787 /DNA_START=184 /DNA_END=540 /DNA_ORIENTATION=+